MSFLSQYIRKSLTNYPAKESRHREQITPILYYDDISPPVRFVLMTANYVGAKLDLRKINLLKEEHKSENYKKVTVLQKVPALVVNKQTMVESHAIAIYLCEKYKDVDIYPNEPFVRGKIHEMMFYNNGTLFPIDNDVYSKYFTGDPTIDEKYIQSWKFAMDYLETHLCNHKWLSGDKMTLSDICCVSTVSSLQILLPFQNQRPQLTDWMTRMQRQPFYKPNACGLKRLQDALDLIIKRS